MLQLICQQCVARIANLKVKGKKTRDTLSFEFMVGAATGLVQSNHPEAQHVVNVVAAIISVRGYPEIERIATMQDVAA
jgi:hypothetical protein